MRALVVLCLTLGGTFAAGPGAAAQEPTPDRYLTMTEEIARLTHPLVLQEEQWHAGGRSIKRWSISRDGKWRYIRFSLDSKGKELPRTRKELGRGALSQEQLRGLAAVLRSQRLLNLPTRLGKSTVNAHLFRVSFGKEVSVLYTLSPRGKESVKENILGSLKYDQPEAWRRFATIAQTVVNSCKVRVAALPAKSR